MIIDFSEWPLYQCHKQVRALKISEISGDFHRPIIEFKDELYVLSILRKSIQLKIFQTILGFER